MSDKDAAISAAILAAVDAGMTPREAFNKVLGAGAYDRVAAQIWDAFQPHG